MDRTPTDLNIKHINFYLALIEKFIGRKATFPKYITSNDFTPNDIISVQREASAMMRFVGLENYTAVISFVKQDSGIAGSINLNNDKEVFIDISSDLLTSPNSKGRVLAVMAHEICHKLLFVRGLHISDTTKNEFCTDLATVYVGFGLLTINGCYVEKKWTEHKTNPDFSQSTIEYTQSFQTGYLSPKTYILAYIIVAQSYELQDSESDIKVNNKKLQDSLNAAKAEAITFKFYTKDAIRQNFIIQSEIASSITRDIIILRSLLNGIEKDISEDYLHLDELYNHLINKGAESHPIGALYAMRYDHITDSSIRIHRNLTLLIHHLRDNQSSLLQNEDLFKFISCPFCGHKSTTPLTNMDKSIRKCKCGRIFLWNAQAPKEEKHTFFNRFRYRVARLLGL